MGLPNLDWFSDLEREYPPAARYRREVEDFKSLAKEDAEDSHRLSEENLQLHHELAVMAAELADVSNRRRFLLEYQTILFDKASTYSNLLISAGYAGLFATWSTTSKLMTPLQNRWIALLGLGSLCVFVGWEIAKMIHSARTTRTLAEAFNCPDSKFNEVEVRMRINGSKSEQRFRRLWVIQLWAALLLGLGSTGVLVYSIIERLLHA